MSLVADTGPLIALAKLDRLDLLRQLFGEVYIVMTGVVGLLILAKSRGYVQHVRPVLEELRSQGYWLSDELITLAAELAGELNRKGK